MDSDRAGSSARSPGSPPPRQPLKEGLGALNEKLTRLLGKVKNFNDHLFHSPEPSKIQPEQSGPGDFAEMVGWAHLLVEDIENRLDQIRDRF